MALDRDPPTTPAFGPGRAAPPVVDWPRTRLLERRQLLRSWATEASVADMAPGAVDLEVTTAAPHVWSGLPEFGWPGQLDPAPARMRVEVLGERTLRVRFAAGELPVGDTPMLAAPVETLVSSGPEPVVEVDHATLALGDATVRLSLSPPQIDVVDAEGRTVASVGGPEKNAFGVWDAWSTGVSRTEEGEPVAHECFALRPGEAVWGLGEHFTRFNRDGQTIDLTADETYGTGTWRAYKNVPFWVSSHGYGVYVNQSARITVWVGSRSAPDVQLAVEDDHLDWFLFLGTPKEVLGAYTALTGRASIPPRWSFGFWQSKISYSSADEVLDVVRRQREADIPMDVVHVDTNWFRENWFCDLEFDPERFPDPEGLCRSLDEMGVKLSLWQLPYIPEGSALFDELTAADGFVRTTDGDLYDVGVCITPGFSGRVGCVDFTNPEAVAVWQRWLGRLLEAGVSAIKVDFGEQAPLDGVWHDGTPGHLMHNLYPLLYAKSAAEVTERVTGASVIWARSAWAGSQRYPVHWGGDNHPNWHSPGPQLDGGLGLAMCGFSFWSQDIGGFSADTGGDLLVRWMQFGVLLSHARIHGMGTREIDAFDEPVRSLCRDAIHLCYRLMPYLWASGVDAAAHGLPMARPLALEFPDDPTTWSIGDQWLLGDALLVAPVLDPTARRRVYVPEGRWEDWWSGEVVDGGRWLDVDAPLDRIPLWLRAGHPVPLGPVMAHVDERPIDALQVRLALLEGDGASLLVVPVSDDAAVTLRYFSADDGTTQQLEVSGAPITVTVVDAAGNPVVVDVVRDVASSGA